MITTKILMYILSIHLLHWKLHVTQKCICHSAPWSPSHKVPTCIDPLFMKQCSIPRNLQNLELLNVKVWSNSVTQITDKLLGTASCGVSAAMTRKGISGLLIGPLKRSTNTYVFCILIFLVVFSWVLPQLTAIWTYLAEKFIKLCTKYTNMRPVQQKKKQKEIMLSTCQLIFCISEKQMFYTMMYSKLHRKNDFSPPKIIWKNVFHKIGKKFENPWKIVKEWLTLVKNVSFLETLFWQSVQICFLETWGDASIMSIPLKFQWYKGAAILLGKIWNSSFEMCQSKSWRDPSSYWSLNRIIQLELGLVN